jgi:hypothetical protein
MLKKTFVIFSLLTFSASAESLNKSFGEWLVSCKTSYTGDKDCFIGTPFRDDNGNGAIVFTSNYLAVSHDELNLSKGVEFSINKQPYITSFMNTGLNVFFKNADRKLLVFQMQEEGKIEINITGIARIDKSLAGFKKAYKFYVEQING